MRLSRRSKEILELLAAFGMEVAQATIDIPILYRQLSSSSEYSFGRTMRSLESRGFIRLKEGRQSKQWVGKLTRIGEDAIRANLNPDSLWSENWDGNWRVMTFDLPSNAHSERQSLRNWLEHRRFGRLQGSVWITPRELNNWTSDLEKLSIDPTSVTFVTGKLGTGRNPIKYVERAWDFEQINQAYERYIEHIKKTPYSEYMSSKFMNWFREETRLWNEAFEKDPLLPKELWPKSKYFGPNAYERRIRAYKKWRTILF